MKRQRVSLQPGFVLHHRAFRDSSQIFECFSRDHGRVALVARGSRRPRSRLHGILQPFRPLLLSWSSRGDLGTLVGAESETRIPALTPAATMAGFYVNELLMRLLQRHDPYESVFADYMRFLSALNVAGQIEPALRRFEYGMLQALGYGLNLESDIVEQRPLTPDDWYEYRLEHGAVPVAAPDGGDLVFSGAHLLALREGRLDDVEARRSAKRLLQAALSLYLGDHPLKSRTVMQAMHRHTSSQ